MIRFSQIRWSKIFGLKKERLGTKQRSLRQLAYAIKAAEMRDFDGAMKYLGEALRLDPFSRQSLLIRAKIYYDMGRLPEAIADCSTLLASEPTNFAALSMRSAFYGVHSEPEKMIEDLRAAHQIKPKDVQTLEQLAALLHEEKKFEEAAGFYSLLIETKPEARHFLGRGRCLSRLGKKEEAIADFDEALRLNPLLLDAVDARAHAKANASRYGEAVQDYDELLKLHPLDPITYYNRALSRRKKGDVTGAIADYTRAIELDPNFEKAFFNRAFAYNKLGQYDLTEADLKKCVELKPCKPAASNGLAWLYSTCPEARFRNGKTALEWAQKAYTISDGKLKNVYDTMAAAYAELGEFEAAVEWEQRYLRLDLTPTEAEAGRKRLVLHQARQPYREEPPPAA